MKIYDETTKAELANPDIAAGYLYPGRRLVRHVEEIREIMEGTVTAICPAGLEHIIPAHDEYEECHLYHAYTEDELATRAKPSEVTSASNDAEVPANDAVSVEIDESTTAEDKELTETEDSFDVENAAEEDPSGSEIETATRENKGATENPPSDRSGWSAIIVPGGYASIPAGLHDGLGGVAAKSIGESARVELCMTAENRSSKRYDLDAVKNDLYVLAGIGVTAVDGFEMLGEFNRATIIRATGDKLAFYMTAGSCIHIS